MPRCLLFLVAPFVIAAGGGCGEARPSADDTAAAEARGDAGDAEAGSDSPTTCPEPADWYRDVVFYHVWLRSFYDHDGDGIGDLRGFIEKLDYVDSLGVGAVWLSPFYPSPYFDSGYDISDYAAIHPDLGTMADWDELLDKLHARGIRLFNDLVMNHTSIEHPWFAESRASLDNPKRDWYVWATEPDLPCVPYDTAIFGDSSWTEDPTTGQYYFHQFYPQQPDLNYRNPAVAQAMLSAIRFWLERGVDGFRVDAITTLIEDLPGRPTGPEFLCLNHPETHDFLRSVRALADEFCSAPLVAEAWAKPAETAAYFGKGSDEFHLSFSLTLSVGTQAALAMNGPKMVVEALAEANAPLPPGAQWGTWLSNHDQPRIMATLADDPRRAALAAALLMTTPGTPFLYYGDELGVTHGLQVVVDKRDRSRTPMPWKPEAKVGFTTGEPWLAPAPNWETANVATQEDDPDSLLNLYRKLIELRGSNPAFGRGDFDVLAGDQPADRVLAFVRRAVGGGRPGAPAGALVLLHFGDQDASFELTLPADAPAGRQPSLATFLAPALPAAGPLSLSLPPYAVVMWEW